MECWTISRVYVEVMSAMVLWISVSIRDNFSASGYL